MKKGLIFLALLVIFLLTTNQMVLAKEERNQIQTQNAGEEQELRIETQEHMSDVAKQVQILLEERGDEKYGLGPQISEFAKSQNDSQEKLQIALDKIEEKSKLSKLLWGVSEEDLQEAREEWQATEARLKELTQIRNKTQNQADQSQLQELEQSMLAQQAAIANKLNTETNTFSVKSWLGNLWRKIIKT